MRAAVSGTYEGAASGGTKVCGNVQKISGRYNRFQRSESKTMWDRQTFSKCGAGRVHSRNNAIYSELFVI